jgi:calcium-binding protein CML
MAEDENENVPMAECGACRAVIPLDSAECPQCDTKFSGVSDEALGECGACQNLVPLDSTRCPECGVVFVADDVVDILRTWVHTTGINIRKLFEKFDENSDGTIDAAEMRKGLLGLNLADLPPSQVDRLVAEIDADGNGVIDLGEFDAILMGDADEELEPVLNDEADEEVSTDPDGEVTIDDEVEEQELGAEESNDPTDEVEDAPSEGDEEDEPADVEDVESDEDLEVEDDDNYADDSPTDDDAESDVMEEEATVHPLQALADMMDEHEISAQRMFNELDADGNGLISLGELESSLVEKYGDLLEIDNLQELLEGVDTDGDGMIDITEFIESMENLDDHEEVVKEEKPPKQFPTVWQKRMMSKTWNDNVWPIVHVGFGILIALVLVNALVGPVDGSGGSVVFQEMESSTPPRSMELVDGISVYPCDNEYQDGGCKNSLTPLAGENGASSMPKGFYWDGILFLLLSVAGLCGSLFVHLVKAPGWRARVKAMKEVADDKADASGSDETSESDGETSDTDADHDQGEGDGSNDEGGEEFDAEHGEEADDESEVEGEEDSIDIGSHIGLVLEDEEVYGTIIEFDDDEGTVTIEEDGTGDLVTGYQEDMFIE